MIELDSLSNLENGRWLSCSTAEGKSVDDQSISLEVRRGFEEKTLTFSVNHFKVELCEITTYGKPRKLICSLVELKVTRTFHFSTRWLRSTGNTRQRSRDYGELARNGHLQLLTWLSPDRTTGPSLHCRSVDRTSTCVCSQQGEIVLI